MHNHLREIKGKVGGRVGHLDRLLAGKYLEERASYLWEHCCEIQNGDGNESMNSPSSRGLPAFGARFTMFRYVHFLPFCSKAVHP